jgi:hypothetical protein
VTAKSGTTGNAGKTTGTTGGASTIGAKKTNVKKGEDTDNGEPNTPKGTKAGAKDNSVPPKDIQKRPLPTTKKDSGKSLPSVKKGPLTKEDKEDADDPIAQAMRLREKAGGITSTVSAADIKKGGLGAGGSAGAGAKGDPKATKPATMEKKNAEEEKK